MNDTHTYTDLEGNQITYTLIDRSTTPGKDCISINVLTVNGLRADSQQVRRYKAEIKKSREVVV